MEILIDRVRISGFRGIGNIEVELSRLTLLIGINNSGKTSIIKAMQLALGDYSRYLTDEDFHINSNDSPKKEITVDVRIVPVTETGAQTQEFDVNWTREFGENIRADSDGKAFVAFRTIGKPDDVKGGFGVERFVLDQWPDFKTWRSAQINRRLKIRGRIDSLRHISIDAQRDIHQELKEKNSFVGKVLSEIQYEESEVKALEDMIKELNKRASEKSESLGELKTQLDGLNQTFEGAGQVDITPFPKKIRNLSKYFNIHFGESEINSLPMEYHGMGTRSWASMLTVRAFTELLKKNHQGKQQFFPITTIEEPEAHLHPNAQRTSYEQLADIDGQMIVSSHSPYLVSVAELEGIRVLNKIRNRISVRKLLPGLNSKEINVLKREIMRFRGEIIFANALILAEGITDEQLIPAMYKLWCGRQIYAKGVNCVGVGGRNYLPFVQFGMSFGIPVCIVSDNEDDTKRNVEGQVNSLKSSLGPQFEENNFAVEYLGANNNIESELLNVLGMRYEIIEALVAVKTKGSTNVHYVASKRNELKKLSDDELLELMRTSKTSYSNYLADIIVKNPQQKKKEELIPEAVLNAFTKLSQWLDQ